MIYFLLLDRKMRQPSHEDTDDAKQRSRSGSRRKNTINLFVCLVLLFFFSLADVPQKRVDRHRSNGNSYGQSPNPHRVGQLAEGSPLVSRRPLYSNIK